MRTAPLTKIIQAAILSSRGRTQAEIAQELDCDPSLVSRWLRRAEAEKWLINPPPMPPSLNQTAIPNKELAAAKKQLSCLHLQKRVDGALARLGERDMKFVPWVTISKSVGTGTTAKEWDRRIAEVGRAAAVRFLELAPRVRRVGITWGKTLRAFVDQIDGQRIRKKNLRVSVPLCGEPSFSEKPTPSSLLASRLAGDLALKIGPHAESYELPVPASIPRECEGDKEVLLSFFRRLPAYAAIIGSEPQCLINKLDTIITSCGGAGVEFTDPWLEARIKAEGEQRDKWHKMVDGDVGGILFPRNDRTEAINARWLGAKISDFQRTAAAAAKSNGKQVGVILIAHGKSKARIVFHAIREGCVNEIICDDELASHLLVHIDEYLATAQV